VSAGAGTRFAPTRHPRRPAGPSRSSRANCWLSA